MKHSVKGMAKIFIRNSKAYHFRILRSLPNIIQWLKSKTLGYPVLICKPNLSPHLTSWADRIGQIIVVIKPMCARHFIYCVEIVWSSWIWVANLEQTLCYIKLYLKYPQVFMKILFKDGLPTRLALFSLSHSHLEQPPLAVHISYSNSWFHQIGAFKKNWLNILNQCSDHKKWNACLH